jgi:hypothetical protein
VQSAGAARFIRVGCGCTVAGERTAERASRKMRGAVVPTAAARGGRGRLAPRRCSRAWPCRARVACCVCCARVRGAMLQPAPAPAAARRNNLRRRESRSHAHAHTHAHAPPHPPHAATARLAACTPTLSPRTRPRPQRLRCCTTAARSGRGADAAFSRAIGGDVSLRSGQVVDIVLSSGFLAFAYHAGFLAAVEDAGARGAAARCGRCVHARRAARFCMCLSDAPRGSTDARHAVLARSLPLPRARRPPGAFTPPLAPPAHTPRPHTHTTHKTFFLRVPSARLTLSFAHFLLRRLAA